MGIDGAEIKRLRLLREQEDLARKQANAPPPLPEEVPQLPQDDPPQHGEPKKHIFIRAFNLIAKAAGAVLLCIVVLGIIANLSTDNDKPTSDDHPTSQPEPTSSNDTTTPYTPTVGYADAVAAILNTSYGNVCRAEIHGIFSKTLQIDWTGNTNKLHMMKVLAEIGSVKEKLYEDGVRYFQFPNDAGTYNVIDWKTGGKESISDRAPYYFSD